MTEPVGPSLRPHGDTLIPIVLGVTGHVDPCPEDRPALKAAVAEILADFRARYPNTPIVVMSSLARGADQVAAEAAFESGREGRVRVVAPLPFPAEVYAQSTSFEGDVPARRQFLDWIAKGSVASFVVRRPDGAAEDDVAAWTRLAHDRDGRRACYANAGSYIVRHCNALIALWDGRECERPSGTAEVVASGLIGSTPRLDPWRGHRPALAAGELVPVYVVHTPRARGAADGPRAGSWSVRVPDSDRPDDANDRSSGPGPGDPHPRTALGLSVRPSDLVWRPTPEGRFFRRVAEAMAVETSAGGGGDAARARKEYHRFHETCQTIDDFNRDAASHAPPIAKRLAGLPGSDVGAPAPWLSPPEPLVRLIRLRAAAAEMANRLDERYGVGAISVFLLLFLAVSSFHVYAHWEIEGGPGPRDPDWLAAFLVLLFLDAVLVASVWADRLAERRHDYRALAEALRVRVYWGLAGVGRSVADSYLGQLRSEMSWTRRALLSAAPQPSSWSRDFDGKPLDDRLALLSCVRRAWVEQQATYFKSRFGDSQVKARRLRLRGFGLAVLGWMVAAALFAWPRDDEGRRPAAHPPDWALIGSAELVLLGAILLAYGERRSYEELARQYERMHVVFSRGDAELQRFLEAKDVDSARAVFEELGREAITEHAQWLILRRSRPFELPIT